MDQFNLIRTGLAALAVLALSANAFADTVDFRDNGSFITNSLTEGIVTVTGSGQVGVSSNGLGISGIGVSSISLEPGETMIFSFAASVTDVVLIDIFPSDIGNDGLALNATLESFDADGTSTANTVMAIEPFSPIDVSNTLGVANMSSFSITMNNDSIRIGGISFQEAGGGPVPPLVEVDDGACNSRPVSDNSPSRFSIWASMAQSFTAPSSRISFGFRLKGAVPAEAGKSVIYNLYEGEVSPLTILASRTVQFPDAVLASGGCRSGQDAGYVEADFSAVDLTVGQTYSIEVTVPSGDLPAPESSTGISVWTSLANPYPNGRFYFPLIAANPVSINNQFFVEHDMLFRISGNSPAARLATLQSKVTGEGPGKSLFNKITLAQTYLAVPDVQSTCAVLSDFLNQVRAQRGKKLTPELADQLTAEAQSIMDAIGCDGF